MRKSGDNHLDHFAVGPSKEQEPIPPAGAERIATVRDVRNEEKRRAEIAAEFPDVPPVILELLHAFEDAVVLEALGHEFNVFQFEYERDQVALDDARRNLLGVLYFG